MAAPNAAGAAALIWSANPGWNSYQVAAQLLATADNIDAVNPTYAGLMGTGRVNSYAALTTTIGAPIVKSLTGLPDEGSVVPPTGIDQFTVAFSQVMDPATANNIANFELTGTGPDNLFGNADDIIFTLSTSTTYQVGTNQMTFEISGAAFECGQYRLRLVSGGLTNPFGTALDGDANGTGGDDFMRNFFISPVIYTDDPVFSTCYPDDADLLIEVAGFCGSNVSLSVTGNPAGTTVSFSHNPPSDGYSTLTIGNIGITAPGTYPITVNSTFNGLPSSSFNVDLIVQNSSPGTPTLLLPANLATNVESPTLTWSLPDPANTYTVEIATDAGFSNIIERVENLTGSNYQPKNLLTLITYYWRVMAVNSCGNNLSGTFSFTTANFIIFCNTYTPANLPLGVPPTGTSGTTISNLLANSC